MLYQLSYPAILRPGRWPHLNCNYTKLITYPYDCPAADARLPAVYIRLLRPYLDDIETIAVSATV